MRTLIKNIIIVIILGIIFSCSKEANIEPVQTNTVPVHFSTKSSIGDISDNVTYQKVRIIAARTNGLIVYNSLFTNIGEELIANLLPNTYNIYVIINETPSMNFTNLQDESLINTIKIDKSNSEAATESSIICFNKEASIIINKTAQGTAQISKDNGASWQDKLYIDVKRVHAKLSLYMCKQTDVANDKFTVKSVKLIRIPQYGYLSPQIYTENNTAERNLFTGAIAFDGANTNTYTNITLNNIIPEHLTTTTSADNIMALAITVDYIPASSNVIFPVTYTVPLLGYTPTDFNIYRNNHYKIYVKIKDRGNISYLPYCQIEVSKWENGNNPNTDIDIGSEVYNYNWNWTNGTLIDPDGTIRVATGSYVELNFNLISPAGSTWIAHIGNTTDFEFSTLNGAVTAGNANSNITYKIRIRPKKAVTSNNVQTTFYIVIDNGVTQKRIGFNGKTSLTIKQIPS